MTLLSDIMNLFIEFVSVILEPEHIILIGFSLNLKGFSLLVLDILVNLSEFILAILADRLFALKVIYNLYSILVSTTVSSSA